MKRGLTDAGEWVFIGKINKTNKLKLPRKGKTGFFGQAPCPARAQAPCPAGSNLASCPAVASSALASC